MDAKYTEKADKSTQPSSPSTAAAVPEAYPELPAYYNSEPSSQPPRYDKSSISDRPSPSKARPLQAEHRGSGVPASTVAALLATPEPEVKQKRSLRQRLKDWRRMDKELSPNVGHYNNGSSAQWNAFGASIKGYSKR